MKLILIVIRLFAIFFFMNAIRYFPAATIQFYGAPMEPHVRLDLLVIALNTFICLLVFAYPRTLLIGLDATNAREITGTSLTASIQTAGIALIGIYFAMVGLQDLVYYHILNWNMAGYNLANQPMSPQDMAGYWTAVFELCSGVVLIVVSAKISNVLGWLRTLTPGASTQERTD